MYDNETLPVFAKRASPSRNSTPRRILKLELYRTQDPVCETSVPLQVLYYLREESENYVETKKKHTIKSIIVSQKLLIIMNVQSFEETETTPVLGGGVVRKHRYADLTHVMSEHLHFMGVGE